MQLKTVGLQLVRDRFLNFFLSKLSRDFSLRGMSTIQDFQRAIFPYWSWVTWSVMLVVLYVLCMLIWPWTDPRSRSHGD